MRILQTGAALVIELKTPSELRDDVAGVGRAKMGDEHCGAAGEYGTRISRASSTHSPLSSTLLHRHPTLGIAPDFFEGNARSQLGKCTE